jgi:hypothetical protein
MENGNLLISKCKETCKSLYSSRNTTNWCKQCHVPNYIQNVK